MDRELGGIAQLVEQTKYECDDLMGIRDIEIELTGEYGEPVAETKYKIEFVAGEKRDGVTDKEGKIREKKVPRGQFYLILDNGGNAKEKQQK